MNQRKIAHSLILILLFASTLLASPQKPTREQAEKAIRASAYDMMKAFLTQDVATFKRHTAKRTLDLVGLVYEAARQDPRYQQELANARITNSDQFLGYFMLGMATQYLQSVPLSPEAAARRVSNDSRVLFISDSETRIIVGDTEIARARLVAKQWKIDLTDWLKRSVLKEVKDPDLRAKIKHL
jgi:hypothetical protein